MKRANINLLDKPTSMEPTILYFAFNAEDNITVELREVLANFLEGSAINPESFSAWVQTCFAHPVFRHEAQVVSHPVIYYDQHGYRVPYSFLLDTDHGEALVWHWERRIFRGSFTQLEHWLRQGPRELTEG